VSAAVPPGAIDKNGMVLVSLPSGAAFPVHSEEVDWFVERAALYLSQNHFPNISDLQDVDRMLTLELMVFRWSTWLSRQQDYWGDAVDADDLQRSLKEYSTELRQLKKLLGIDKVARDRQRGEDSVAAYIQNLLVRAREFGVMRERQLDKSIELFQQLKALMTLHTNCDETEQREMHVTQEDVFEWIKDVAIPEFDAVDEYFRRNQQRLWIRSQ
jgi:hypothetical protein